MRFRFVAVVFGLLLPSPADAQSSPTVPATITLTCYGYDGGPVRAYNCIPLPHLQPLMRTFVPPPGAPCNQGSVKEFPPGRIVFQIRCQDTDGGGTTQASWSASGRGPSYFDKPINVARVRIKSRFSGYSGNFVVWCRSPSTDLIVNELIGTAWGNDGTVGIYRMANCTEVNTEQTASWTFTQEGGTALTPTRTWLGITGAMNLSAAARPALVRAVEVERQNRESNP